MYAQTRVVHHARKHLSERSVARFRTVVQKVFLELIQNDEQIAFHLRAGGFEHLGERSRLPVPWRFKKSLHRMRNTGCEASNRIVAPRVEDDDRHSRRAARSDVFPRDPPQLARDARPQHRAFPNPARAVEQCQP